MTIENFCACAAASRIHEISKVDSPLYYQHRVTVEWTTWSAQNRAHQTMSTKLSPLNYLHSILSTQFSPPNHQHRVTIEPTTSTAQNRAYSIISAKLSAVEPTIEFLRWLYWEFLNLLRIFELTKHSCRHRLLLRHGDTLLRTSNFTENFRLYWEF